MKTINKQSVIDTIRHIIDENPTKQIVKCVYWKDDKPYCLIGRALYQLGVPSDVLKTLDKRACGGSCRIGGSRAEPILQAHGFRFTQGAKYLCTTVQNQQDRSIYWGQIKVE